jgi:galactonate dehydratase
MSDGYIDLPTSPGLGIEIDEEYVHKRARENVDWHNPVWSYDDGSIAEW